MTALHYVHIMKSYILHDKVVRTLMSLAFFRITMKSTRKFDIDDVRDLFESIDVEFHTKFY